MAKRNFTDEEYHHLKRQYRQAIKCLKEVRLVNLTHGCAECSTIEESQYELNIVTDTLVSLGEIQKPGGAE